MKSIRVSKRQSIRVSKYQSVKVFSFLLLALSFMLFACATPQISQIQKPGDSYITVASLKGDASLSAQAQSEQIATSHRIYKVWCYDKDGNLKWVDEVKNLTVHAGLTKFIDCTLKTGCTSPTWYVFLVTGPGSGTTYDSADTMASHAGWTEDTSYSNATRPAFNTTASISCATGTCSLDNSANKAVFNINATATIAGAGLADSNTKGGSTGTLLGAGDFTGGDRAVQSGDTLNVQITDQQTGS